jgi:Flp pilus assembly protein TadD
MLPVVIAALLLGAPPNQAIRVHPLPDPPRNLVLEVRDASPASHQLPAYFASALSSEIFQDLATIPELNVSFHSSAGTADAVLRVSLSVSGNLVMAATELERAGRVIWHRQFARPAIDSRLLRGDVVGALERLLALDRRVPSAAPPTSRVAYEAFLRGIAAMEKRTEPALLEARDAFTEATLADPEFATGYAALANANSLLGAFGFVPREEAIHRARAAAEMALALAPDSSDAHTARAFVLMETLQVDEALDAYRYALELNPRNVLALHWYGLSVLDREPATGVAHLERAYALAPHSATISTDLGVAYVRTGRLDLAIPHLTRIAQTFPSNVESHNQLAVALVAAGRFEEAVETLERTTQRWTNNTSALSLLGYSYGVLGRRVEARRILGMLRRLSEHAYVPPGILVTVLAGLGDHAEALRIIEQHPSTEWLAFLRADPKLAPLRTHPRFRTVLEQIENRPR